MSPSSSLTNYLFNFKLLLPLLAQEDLTRS